MTISGTWNMRKNEGSTRTHNSASISQSQEKHEWNQKTQHVDDEWDQGISKIFNGVCRCACFSKKEGCQHNKGGFHQPQIRKCTGQSQRNHSWNQKAQHIDGSNRYPQFEAFRIWRLAEQWDLRTNVVSKQTHNSESISQSQDKHEWHQKLNTLIISGTKAFQT